MNYKSLEFLDLAFPLVKTKKLKDSNLTFHCFHNIKDTPGQSPKHLALTDNYQLNLIIDLLLSILQNLTVMNNNQKIVFDSFSSLYNKFNKQLADLSLNLDYLKVSKDLKNLKNIPTKSELENIITTIHKEQDSLIKILKDNKKELNKSNTLESELKLLIQKITE